MRHKGFGTLLFSLFCFFPLFGAVSAQEDCCGEKETLAEQIGITTGRSDRFRLYLNMHMSGDAEFKESRFEGFCFEGDQLRIEAVGQLNSWLGYRYRQQLNKPHGARESIDNLPIGLDLAYLSIRPSERWELQVGRLCASYGGYEFDLNPIYIHQFSDFVDYSPCYFTGLSVKYFSNRHELVFQVLNNRAASFSDIYPQAERLGIEESKAPLLLLFNWNAPLSRSFGMRYSISWHPQSSTRGAGRVMLGHQFAHGGLQAQLDLMYAYEGINARTALMPDVDLDVRHFSSVMNLKYRLTDYWGIQGKGALEYSGKNLFEQINRRNILLHLGVEYYPMPESDLHFFLVGLYQHSRYTTDQDRARLSLGFMYRLPML